MSDRMVAVTPVGRCSFSSNTEFLDKPETRFLRARATLRRNSGVIAAMKLRWWGTFWQRRP